MVTRTSKQPARHHARTPPGHWELRAFSGMIRSPVSLAKRRGPLSAARGRPPRRCPHWSPMSRPASSTGPRPRWASSRQVARDGRRQASGPGRSMRTGARSRPASARCSGTSGSQARPRDTRRGVPKVAGRRSFAGHGPQVPLHPSGRVPPGGQVGMDRPAPTDRATAPKVDRNEMMVPTPEQLSPLVTAAEETTRCWRPQSPWLH